MVLGVRTGGGAFADGSRSPDRESRLQVTKSLPRTRTPTVPAPASENQPGGIGDRRARIGRKMARFSNRGTTVLVPRPLAAAPVMARAQALATHRSGRPGSLLTLAPHRSGRAGSAASGSSTDGFATRRRVPAGPGSQAMATAIPKAYLASSAIRCRDVETGPTLGVLAVFPSTGATCRGPLPSTGSRGLNSPASAVL